ncbi:hypothetical protein [Streptomyces sp. NPDC050504]|uniref:hypothetical protein n=1 Tax=Streptomyces sp. NPDC050504 TaxID=3365618 RepID=UPI0037B38C39
MGGEAAPADPDSDGYADPDRATDPPADPSGAACRTTIEGSRTVAYCHNPYPYADLVRMHTECARWWDVDADTAPVEVAPAQTVRIADRCWREVRAVWITHQKVR